MQMRTFKTGATRNTSDNKYDYSGFLSHTVMKEFARYMHKHRIQADGQLRASNNWKKGIDKQAYMESAFRHFYDFWALHESGNKTITREDGEVVDMKDALCGLLFNIQGYLHEELKN
jgi:hypothetical protein